MGINESMKRRRALRAVVRIFVAEGSDLPDAAELIALADWVGEGSISVATALEGQKAALYNEWERTQRGDEE